MIYPSDILVDQMRAIDNRRFVKRLGSLSLKKQANLLKAIMRILD